MKLSSSLLRLVLVILVVTVFEVFWVWLAPRPMPIAAIIPATIPFWVSLFVIFPIVRKGGLRKRQ